MRSNSTLSGLLLVAAVAVVNAAPTGVAVSKHDEDWLKGPVSYLITKTERETFLHFRTQAERDRFIDQFWEVRNPKPGSPQNEFKDEFYRRVAWADAHYGRYGGTDGWRSDMGKTYILFGKPQTSTNFTANQELHPIELWFYANPGLAELPPFFYVMFFERDDVTGYRLYNPYIDGPDKLMKAEPPKQQAYQYLRNLNPELAQASLTLIPGEPPDTQTFSGSMESNMILNAVQGYRDMPSYVSLINARAARLERVTTHVEYDIARAELMTLVAREQGEPWLHWRLEINDPLQPKAKAGLVAYDMTARLFSHNKLVFERTDSPSFNAPAGSEDTLKRRPFAYEDRMPVVPGDYRLVVTATSRATGKKYETSKEISIPAVSDRAVLSEVLVVSGNEQDSRRRPFEFSGAKFIPAIGDRVRAASGLHILFQLTASGAPPASGYDVEYIIGNFSTKFRKTFTDHLDLSRAEAGSLLTAKTLAIDELSPGTYQLALRIKDPQTAKITAGAATFTVMGGEVDPLPIIISRGGTDSPQWMAVSQYERALCWLAQDRPSEAVADLEASWKLSQNPVTKGLLERLYARTGQKSKAFN